MKLEKRKEERKLAEQWKGKCALKRGAHKKGRAKRRMQSLECQNGEVSVDRERWTHELREFCREKYSDGGVAENSLRTTLDVAH